jgi:hypothetical protein
MHNFELFDSKKRKYELFVFLLIFLCYFMGPNFLGKQVSFKKSVRPTRQHQQPSIKKVTVARPPTSQQKATQVH